MEGQLVCCLNGASIVDSIGKYVFVTRVEILYRDV